ncbi:MAG: ABC transporter permease [Candidatus Onthomonas sp.]
MIYQSAKMALKSVLSNKVRSFLTMLGIIIGVFALVVLVSLVEGTTGYVTDTVSSLGSSYITVSVSDDKGKPFRLADLDEIMESEIGLAAPMAQTNATGKNGRESGNVLLYGTTAAYQDINSITVAYGTFLRQTDVDNHNYVCVINQTMAEELMGGVDCLGQTLNLNGFKFTIIGILSDDDESLTSILTSGMMSAYIPYTTAQRVGSNVPSTVDTFYLSAMAGSTVEETTEQMTDYLMDRFENDEDAFSISDMSMIEDAMGEVTGMLEMLLGGIAAISLLVGGIGIMNIMLVSVTERTREIGIRKAIGASRGTIMLQFLIEALVLSLLGCLLGLLVSWITLAVISQLVENVTFTLSSGIAWVAILFSLAIGLLFGLYPANKAAKKPPIEALRYGE